MLYLSAFLFNFLLSLINFLAINDKNNKKENVIKKNSWPFSRLLYIAAKKQKIIHKRKHTYNFKHNVSFVSKKTHVDFFIKNISCDRNMPIFSHLEKKIFSSSDYFFTSDFFFFFYVRLCIQISEIKTGNISFFLYKTTF